MSLVTPRRLAGTAGISALALALAACAPGSSAGSTEEETAQLSPEEIVLASYDDLESGSYTMAMTMTINGVDFMDATTEVDGEASRSSQDLYMSAILEATGEDIADDPDMAEMMEAMFTDMHTEVILVDGVVYMQISGGMLDMSGEFGEDAWFTLDLAEHVDLNEVYDQVGGLDLASQTDTLLTDITDVTETGDGIYSGTLSGDSEVMQSMLGTTAGAAAAPDTAAQDMIDAAEVVITVDDEGVLKTMEIVFPEIEGMTMNIVSEIIEIGGDYDIAAPESDNLHSFEEFSAGMLAP